MIPRTSSRIAEDDKVNNRGARIGSRIRWAEEGEASTRFFLGLEKQRSNLFSARAIDMSAQDTSICSIKSFWRSFKFV